MLKRLIILLVLITVILGIIYTLSPEVGPHQIVAGYDGCFDSKQYGIGPLLVYHCSYPEFTRVFIGRLLIKPYWTDGYAALAVSYEGWGGVWISYFGGRYAEITLLEKERVISPGDTGPSARISQTIYLRLFPPATSSTPLWCVKNMQDEVVGPRELLVTAEAEGGQPFCEYVFEFQRLDGGERHILSNLRSGGNTSVIQWDETGVYAITFRSADGEVLCSYDLVYQPELGNTAKCIVPPSYAEKSKRDIITNP